MRTRAIAGPLVLVTAIGHAVVGVSLFFEPLSAIAREGFVNTIQPPVSSAETHFDRIAVFWFLFFSPVLVLLSQLVNRAVARGDPGSLRLIGWYLVGLGVVGAAILPVSGNWLLIALGAIVVSAANEVASQEGATLLPENSPAA